MRALAVRLGHDPEPSGPSRMLHDLDYEVTEKSPELHTTETVKVLREKGIAEPVIHAVQAHAGKVPCESPMDWAIYSVDPLTGLIIAATLMHPSKKIKSIDLEFVKRRYKEKSFAKGARREEIEQSPQPRPRARRVPVDRHCRHAGDRRRPGPLGLFRTSTFTPSSK